MLALGVTSAILNASPAAGGDADLLTEIRNVFQPLPNQLGAVPGDQDLRDTVAC
jgi:hypothetical protein